MTTYGYARVSTADQKLEAQEAELRAASCNVIFKEIVSGASKARPQLDNLLTIAASGDTIIVTSLDRLGRTLSDLIHLVESFAERGIHLRSLREQLDTSSATGRLIFHVFGAIAEFERELIRERTKRGLAAAKAAGRKGGRPALLTPEKLATANDLIENKKLTAAATARVLNVSKSTLRRARSRGRK